MKAFYILLLFIMLPGTSTFSQILVGPEAGVNYSWASFGNSGPKDAFKMTPIIGYHAGGHLAFKVRNRFFLHASLLYSSKGRVLEGKSDDLLKNTARHNYIDMPINYTVDFKGKIGKSKEFKYFLGIGPNVSYWLGGNGKFFSSELEENNEERRSYKIKFKKSSEDQPLDEMRVDNANRLQLGLSFIAGMIFEPAYKHRVMFSVRYELGHTYLAKSNGNFADLYFQDPLQSRNQGFRISLAYLVDLKTEERKKGKSTIDRRKPK